ncbi:MAG TPA: 7-cyano-7-deazaguanine synthase, partial [bacterium]|nr:7-cyano-7-deazaguanine synthase [bacterium]
LDIPTFTQIGGSSLTDKNLKNPIGEVKKNITPISFVPGRNLIFLTFGAAYAYTKKIYNLVTGVCETDCSNYPDCRNATIKSLEKSIFLGMDFKIKIHTPLIKLTKAQAVILAKKLGALDALAYSHTCYNGTFPPCGKCPACILRANGFEKAGLPDPLLERTKKLKSRSK